MPVRDAAIWITTLPTYPAVRHFLRILMSSLSNPLNLCCPTTIPATFGSTTLVSAAANMSISGGFSSTLVWMSLLKMYCRLPVLLLRRSQLGFLVACIKISTLSKLTMGDVLHAKADSNLLFKTTLLVNWLHNHRISARRHFLGF